MTFPTPVIIQGASIDITTGPLIERNEMIANLRNSYKGLTEASIRFDFPATRGPPHRVVDQSRVYINEKGEIAGPRARLVFVVGDVKNVEFPELRDNSRLDLKILDTAKLPHGETMDSTLLRFAVPDAEFTRYYTESYEWNRVAKAHGVDTLPIDPAYVSRDIRKAIGEETASDREQERKEESKRSAKRETRAHERSVP